MYDAKNDTTATLADVEAAVGERVTLPLTGRIIEARTGDAGAFAIFEVDERWGFGPLALGLDLEAFERPVEPKKLPGGLRKAC